MNVECCCKDDIGTNYVKKVYHKIVVDQENDLRNFLNTILWKIN